MPQKLTSFDTVRSLPAVLGHGVGLAVILSAFNYTGGRLEGYRRDPDVDEVSRKEYMRKNRRRPEEEIVNELGEGRGTYILFEQHIQEANLQTRCHIPSGKNADRWLQVSTVQATNNEEQSASRSDTESTYPLLRRREDEYPRLVNCVYFKCRIANVQTDASLCRISLLKSDHFSFMIYCALRPCSHSLTPRFHWLGTDFIRFDVCVHDREEYQCSRMSSSLIPSSRRATLASYADSIQSCPWLAILS